MTVIGESAPTFSLPDTEGANHAPGDAPATVVVFTCNHCPYALAWHDRILALAHDYSDRGVRVLAINPNDATRYPRDSIEAMRARVQRGEFDGVPYLRDESQEVARAYDAQTTPDVFVLDADRPTALSRRSRRRLRRSLSARRLPARRPRRDPRRPRPRACADPAHWLLDQVAGVIFTARMVVAPVGRP